ncbi:right-handed parallel beta-helix repeat-containing protein [Trinickia dinghuensis]|uniref:right-handed parallel beta-helix repeat-containing protein n=1 Tax=Trinickia dinghuensis TaxID=2291023 RepID=UPI001C69CD71|nr:right-handed parallel beta-helix repeat-containing protein [Trinickia dinghuensis]
MKKLFAFALLLLSSISAWAQFSPGQILTAAALNGQFALYAPLGGATFTGPVTIPTLTVTGAASVGSLQTSSATITGGSISGIAPLPVASGGTGQATPAAHGIAIGEGGTTPFSWAAPSTAGQALVSNGASSDPSFQAVTALGSNYRLLAGAGIDPTGATDSSTAANAMLASGGTIIVPPGTYTIDSDLLYVSNTTFIVSRGATMNFNASRFTPANANVVNVSLIDDGAMNSANLPTNCSQKFSWPSDTGGSPPSTSYERGFIEFGGASGTARSTGFFYVGGHGTITGDWTGTPSITNLWTGDICRKGIATFFGDNVLVEGVNVSGFHGEAVYHYDSTAATINNVIFQNLYVHDTNFNALNFNLLSEARNSYIRNNTVYNSYQGIEISAGHAINNTIRLTQGPGIFTGGGTVQTVDISNNTVDSAQMDGIEVTAATSNTGTGDVEVEGNTIFSAQGNAINGAALNRLSVFNNIAYGYATTASTYGVWAQSNCTYADIRGNRLLGPNGGLVVPIRNQATYASTLNNVYYDTTTGAPVLANTAGYLTTSQTNEYKVIDGVGATGVGHSTIYKIGGTLPLLAQQNYVRTYSSVDTTGATGASGSFHVATHKASTESTTLGDTMVFDQNGNALVTSAGGLGYGTGSGGTVTQTTNKSTTVTLNSPTGQITMNNAALAAGATISFTFNCSVMTANDVLVMSINANSPNAAAYSVRGISSSSAAVFVTNTSSGSLSDAVIINFAVIKGATS